MSNSSMRCTGRGCSTPPPPRARRWSMRATRAMTPGASRAVLETPTQCGFPCASAWPPLPRQWRQRQTGLVLHAGARRYAAADTLAVTPVASMLHVRAAGAHAHAHVAQRGGRGAAPHHALAVRAAAVRAAAVHDHACQRCGAGCGAASPPRRVVLSAASSCGRCATRTPPAPTPSACIVACLPAGAPSAVPWLTRRPAASSALAVDGVVCRLRWLAAAHR